MPWDGTELHVAELRTDPDGERADLARAVGRRRRRPRRSRHPAGVEPRRRPALPLRPQRLVEPLPPRRRRGAGGRGRRPGRRRRPRPWPSPRSRPRSACPTGCSTSPATPCSATAASWSPTPRTASTTSAWCRPAGERWCRLRSPFTALSSLRPFGDGAVLVGASPTTEAVGRRARRARRRSAPTAPSRPRSACCARPATSASTPRGSRSPEPIRFATTGDRFAHALFYPPTHPDARRPRRRGRRRCIVLSHGGPTSAARPQLQPRRPVLDLPGLRRGRRELRRLHRLRPQLPPPPHRRVGHRRRRRLRGRRPPASSTGATSTATGSSSGAAAPAASPPCRALAFREVFAAGCSLYGVADLEALARDTHKFEARYLDSLVGPVPRAPRPLRRALADPQHRRARLPGHRAPGRSRTRSCRPSQSEAMVEALRGQRAALRLPAVRGRAARLPPGRQHPPGARGRGVLLQPGLRVRARRRGRTGRHRQPLTPSWSGAPTSSGSGARSRNQSDAGYQRATQRRRRRRWEPIKPERGPLAPLLIGFAVALVVVPLVAFAATYLAAVAVIGHIRA